MIIELLRLLSAPDVRSKRDLGESLGVDEELLDHLLEDLNARGYVEKRVVDGGGCSRCREACPFAGSAGSTMSFWVPTPKGEEIASRHS